MFLFAGVKLANFAEVAINFGADINHTDKLGNSVLYYAVSSGYLVTICKLSRNSPSIATLEKALELSKELKDQDQDNDNDLKNQLICLLIEAYIYKE